MKQSSYLPTRNWKVIKSYVRQIGEGDTLDGVRIVVDIEFLVNIGLLDERRQLTPIGRHLFEASFIRRSRDEEKNIFQDALLKYQPTLAIQQYLWGIKIATIEQVITVLKSTQLWGTSTRESLTHFLDLLNYVEIISYNKKAKGITVVISPDTEKTPISVFIDPDRPFSNLMWIKKILSECENYIYWFDKHFQKQALDWIWAIADSGKIKEIKILSLDLGEDNLNKDVRNLYKRLKQELSLKGVQLIWSIIDSKSIKDSHDRWIIGGKDTVWNVPNVNAISSGQRSELNRSENYKQILEAFNQYWGLSTEVQI